MQLTYGRATSEDELAQILELQRCNLPRHITEREKEQEGFVTVLHTYEVLERMNAICGHIIAKDGNKVVGYALCTHSSFSEDIDVLRPMFTQIALTIDPGEKYVVMGQICIDKTYRRKGIFQNLYAIMKKLFFLNSIALLQKSMPLTRDQ